MRPFENAATMTLGGAGVAYPGAAAGLGNDAVPGMGEKWGVFLGSALPYGITGWQTAQLQGFFPLSKSDGLGLDLTHSSIEAYSEQRVRLIYGRRLGAKLLVGGSADLLHVSAREYGSAAGVNVGLSVLANPLPDIWLGARVQNPVQFELGDALVPTVFRLGAAWRAGPTLILLAETEKDLERPVQVKAGVEYHPLDLLVLRLGLRTGPGRMAFGGGIRLQNGLAFDTGVEWHPVLGLTPSATIVWRK